MEEWQKKKNKANLIKFKHWPSEVVYRIWT